MGYNKDYDQVGALYDVNGYALTDKQSSSLSITGYLYSLIQAVEQVLIACIT